MLSVFDREFEFKPIMTVLMWQSNLRFQGAYGVVRLSTAHLVSAVV